MSTSLQHSPRWSKKTDELVRHVALRCRPGFQSELGGWLERSSRFRSFVDANRDKIRKKLTTSDDEDSRLDVRAELLVAFLVLGDRRFELALEAYGARRLGPDLTASYRTNARFNLEVTRIRAVGEAVSGDPDSGAARVAHVVTGKLRQLPGDLPNALVIVARGLALSEDSLGAAARTLKMRADHKDDEFFARRGFKSARDFYAQYLRLGGVFVMDEAATTPQVLMFSNPEARHALPREAAAAVSVCLSAVRTLAE